jgi:hypothetical protein
MKFFSTIHENDKIHDSSTSIAISAAFDKGKQALSPKRKEIVTPAMIIDPASCRPPHRQRASKGRASHPCVGSRASGVLITTATGGKKSKVPARVRTSWVTSVRRESDFERPHRHSDGRQKVESPGASQNVVGHIRASGVGPRASSPPQRRASKSQKSRRESERRGSHPCVGSRATGVLVTTATGVKKSKVPARVRTSWVASVRRESGDGRPHHHSGGRQKVESPGASQNVVGRIRASGVGRRASSSPRRSYPAASPLPAPGADESLSRCCQCRWASRTCFRCCRRGCHARHCCRHGRRNRQRW